MKSLEFVLNIIFFVSKKFSKDLREYTKIENPSYKNENTDKKYLYNMQENQFLTLKNSLLELEKDFTELKERELKVREKKD